MENNYKGNSHKQRNADEKEKMKPVVTNAKVSKTTISRKIAESFISEETYNVKDYVIFDVILPTIKNMLYDAMVGAIGMTFGVDTRRSRSNRNDRNRESYTRYYREKDEPRRAEAKRNDYSDIIFETFDDAEDVLDALTERLKRYDAVTVADLYEATGMPTSFTDNNRGWYDLSNARIDRLSGNQGYLLRMPRVRVLD